MTKAEKIALAALGVKGKRQVPIITSEHPFLADVALFMVDKDSWNGTISELLIAVGDDNISPITASKLLHRFDKYMLKNCSLKISFNRYNCVRLIEIVAVA